MKVYLTRFALTEGICLAEVELSQTDERRVTVLNGGHHFGIFYKPDWHVTAADAINRAEQMRKEKIKFLRTQIDCLEHLDFYKQIKGA